MPKNLKKRFIYNLILKNQFVTTFHFDGNFMEFWNSFYPKSKYSQAAINFVYHCRTLNIEGCELIEIDCLIKDMMWQSIYGVKTYRTFIVSNRILFTDRAI